MHESFAKWRAEPLQGGRGAHERRADMRHVAVRWLARLRGGGLDELCVVHNISASTLIAEIFAPRTLGESVLIELGDGQTLSGTVVWASETNVEVRFPQTIDVARLVDGHDETAQPAPPGTPRLEASCQGWIELAGETMMVEVCDLSQGGARIAADVSPALGQHAMLVIPGLPPIAGEIRWREEGKCGIAFHEPVAFDTLAGWIVARDAQPGTQGQARRWPRYSMLLKTLARLDDVSGPIETIVHNISRGGVLISCRRGLRQDDEVELGLGSTGPVRGRVVWVGEGQAGVEFDRTIDAEHVLHPLGERSVPPVLHHYPTGRRPGLNSHKAH